MRIAMTIFSLLVLAVLTFLSIGCFEKTVLILEKGDGREIAYRLNDLPPRIEVQEPVKVSSRYSMSILFCDDKDEKKWGNIQTFPGGLPAFLAGKRTKTYLISLKIGILSLRWSKPPDKNVIIHVGSP